MAVDAAAPNGRPPVDRVHPILDWLPEASRGHLPLDALFTALCERLAAAGFPIDRVSLNLEMLHPEVSGEGRVWLAGNGLSTHRVAPGVEDTPDYLDSPIRIVDETERPFRQVLRANTVTMPLLRRLCEEGFRDYAIFPLPFQDGHRTAAMSFATRRDDGFQVDDLLGLERIVQSLAPLVEARVVRLIAGDLLSVYLGRDPGERVLQGKIRRGDTDTIFAAVWFCDLRGFTAFAQENLSGAVIQRLNDWFELAVNAVEANDGEVLKFMGDGLLAIFPADSLNPRLACGHALNAARHLGDAVADWNQHRHNSAPPIDYGLALHLGHVSFGNIGGARRLDFTVVGPAVNATSRLMDLAKTLDRRVVVSQAFAGCSGRELRSLGKHELRGLPRPEEVFAPE